jgi:CRISPR-associated protein Cas2
MARPKKKKYSPEEQLQLMLKAGLIPLQSAESEKEADALSQKVDEDYSLNERIRQLLKLVRSPADAPYSMLYLILYDITDNRVRTHIAKYLISKGCIRIQKSVYLAKTKQKTFREINTTLAEVQAAYDNKDSILLIPVQAATVGSMKIIGKSLQIDSLIDPPNTIFY